MTDPLVNTIFKSAGSNSSGLLNEDQLKSAILSNLDKVEVITESAPAPVSNPIVSQVMAILDDSGSGTIGREDLEEALAVVAEQNPDTEIDVKTLASAMFNKRTGLNRRAVRQYLNINLAET